ncbi:ATP-grasp fold amidoligase family protein [Sphingomonas sp. CD22]|uniref:ATP-grasp fold amidoligase family protein n=1 Tax=Sphingomonas sp. CD22 TaxID=3100214 RepID=UPI002ADFEB15|nr:ATP-grasp fold amidoligase family protein [Sphingomonas sp. CD22]MEA1086341.1 ATP-grasp fold amidoligase family protein [Sphingomonas sp. CD22]
MTAHVRLHLLYWWRHRRRLSLATPRLFTELIQQRKLLDRDPRMPWWIDKLAVKVLVADRLGAEWVTPTLWSGRSLPPAPPCSAPFVVKSRHGCNQHAIVRSDDADWNRIRRVADGWMRKPYGAWLDEWGYRDVPRGLLIEPFIGTGPDLPIDYKLFVFHGRVAAIQVHLARETDHRWIVFDRSWRRISKPSRDADTVAPASLAQMIDGAETLGHGFAFVRVDLYEIDDRPRFGEMTFYPGSGLEPVEPPELDAEFGRLWCGPRLASAPGTAPPVYDGPAASLRI